MTAGLGHVFHPALGRCLSCARPWGHCFVLLFTVEKPEEATLCLIWSSSCSHSHVWQPYLQVIVEELPHALEAASGQLVLLQPAQSAAHVVLIDVNVRTGLSKGPGYKSRQPVSTAQRNPVSQPGHEPAGMIGLGWQ